MPLTVAPLFQSPLTIHHSPLYHWIIVIPLRTSALTVTAYSPSERLNTQHRPLFTHHR
ncbi:uncharacterized protein DS421_6g198580 [Arachis hypogaea]|nr:uncharacterized protein DS421_6g198580 [Arachis hypogaea]